MCVSLTIWSALVLVVAVVNLSAVIEGVVLDIVSIPLTSMAALALFVTNAAQVHSQTDAICERSYGLASMDSRVTQRTSLLRTSSSAPAVTHRDSLWPKIDKQPPCLFQPSAHRKALRLHQLSPEPRQQETTIVDKVGRSPSTPPFSPHHNHSHRLILPSLTPSQQLLQRSSGPH